MEKKSKLKIQFWRVVHSIPLVLEEKFFRKKKYFDHRWQIVPFPFGDKCNVLPVLWQEKDLVETIETFFQFYDKKKNHISEQMESSGQYFCCQLKRVWKKKLFDEAVFHTTTLIRLDWTALVYHIIYIYDIFHEWPFCQNGFKPSKKTDLSPKTSLRWWVEEEEQ